MDLSIVIPTYNERDNVRPIVNRIRSVLSEQSCNYEILFIDDSQDDTPATLAELSNQYAEVKYLHRETEKGLASAVVRGFALAKGESIIVMDADLQHPPQLIPLIYKRLSTADIVIPSRFIAGGSDGGLNHFRQLISWTARSLAQLSIKRLRNISDCTSGYFGLNRSVIRGVDLTPLGWKILMEVLVKGNYHTIHEIPYSFVARDAGQSKMNCREQWNYLRHIARLVRSRSEDRRFFFFCMVGILGIPVNLLALHILLNLFQTSQMAASINASCAAMTHNFLWNESITWKECRQPILWKRLLHFPQFILVSSLGIAITALFAQTFLSIGWNMYIGQLFGIFTATYWNFMANDRWTWSGSLEGNLKQTDLVVTQECTGKLS
jgi:dolichol-phosphate mannosyltransferase